MIAALGRFWPLTLRGTGALVLATVCFVVAQEVGLPELLYFAVLLTAAVVAALAAAWLTRRIDAVTRSLSPDVVTVGKESTVTVRVSIRTALPASPGAWEDTVPTGLEGRARGVFPAPDSAGRGEERLVELSYRVTGRVRGVYSLGPLRVSATDPFGLARRSIRVGSRTSVTVAPRVVELTALPTSTGESGGMLQTATTQLGQGADNLVARPHAPGDSMRRIHWRATAHRDTLMVRQEEQEASPTATVVLDRGAGHWDTAALAAPGADPGFETAVSLAISAAARLVRDGYTVTVIDADGTPLADPIPGGEVHEIDALATDFTTLVARPGDDPSRIGALFGGAQTGPVVIVTGRVEPHDAEVLGALAHRSTFAVLLASAAAEGVVALLRDRGWHAAVAAEGSDPADAWDVALEGRGDVAR